jgi:hypothetical protein
MTDTGDPMHRFALALVATLAMSATFTNIASAHQTVSSNGARVTMHVNPDDQPEAGQASLIKVLKVAVPRGSRFSYSSCGCRLKISNSAGKVLRDARMTTRSTFTFPSTGAYRLTYSGSYTRSGKRKRFAASFAIRAV